LDIRKLLLGENTIFDHKIQLDRIKFFEQNDSSKNEKKQLL